MSSLVALVSPHVAAPSPHPIGRLQAIGALRHALQNRPLWKRQIRAARRVSQTPGGEPPAPPAPIGAVVRLGNLHWQLRKFGPTVTVRDLADAITREFTSDATLSMCEVMDVAPLNIGRYIEAKCGCRMGNLGDRLNNQIRTNVYMYRLWKYGGSEAGPVPATVESFLCAALCEALTHDAGLTGPDLLDAFACRLEAAANCQLGRWVAAKTGLTGFAVADDYTENGPAHRRLAAVESTTHDPVSGFAETVCTQVLEPLREIARALRA